MFFLPPSKYPGVGLVDHIVVLFFFFFGEIPQTGFQCSTNLHPHQQCMKVPFPKESVCPGGAGGPSVQHCESSPAIFSAAGLLSSSICCLDAQKQKLSLHPHSLSGFSAGISHRVKDWANIPPSPQSHQEPWGQQQGFASTLDGAGWEDDELGLSHSSPGA